MDVSDQLVEVQDPLAKPRRFVFVLLESFTMLCFSAAVESLRIANRMSGRELYSWTLMSETGEPVICSGGIEYRVNSELIEVLRCLLYTSPSPRDGLLSRMPSSA